MTSSYLDDDDQVFYGGERSSDTSSTETSKPATGSSSNTDSNSGSSSTSDNLLDPDKKSGPSEQELEKQIQDSRLEKRKVESVHDITILRQRGAEQSQQAAKYYKKYRIEEAAQVKHEQMVFRNRRKSEKYLEKVKDVEVKIADKEAATAYLEGAKKERAHIKVAKLRGKIAKLKAKSSNADAIAAKHRQKAVARQRKATELLEKSKIHEAEAKSYSNRADKLEKIS